MLFPEFFPPPEPGYRHLHYGDAAAALNVRVAMTGYETARAPGYEWDGMTRGETGFLVWQCTVSGCGELETGGRRLRIPPGTAMLVRVPDAHRYRVAPDAGTWEFVFAILRGSESLRLGGTILENASPVGPEYASAPVLRAAAELFRSGDNDDPYTLSQHSYQLLMALVRAAALPGGVANPPPGLRTARNAALRNFDRGIGVAELAETAHWGYAHFCREFHRVFGVAPGAFLSKLRLEKAVDLLQNSRLPVQEIAVQCGFSTASYFVRVFVRRFGVSPGAFRRNRP